MACDLFMFIVSYDIKRNSSKKKKQKKLMNKICMGEAKSYRLDNI